jgi:hypothetical protein
MKLPQLTLRDWFWLVALAAMGCGWWADRRSFQRQLNWFDHWSKEQIDRVSAEQLKMFDLESHLKSRGYELEWTEDGKPIVNMNARSSDLHDAINAAGYKTRLAEDGKPKLVPLDTPDQTPLHPPRIRQRNAP